MSGLAGKRIEEGSEDVGTGQSGLVVAGAMAIKEGSVEHSERLAREEAETLCQGGQRNALFQANTCAKQLSERLCVQSCSQPVKKGTLLPVKKSLNSAVSPFLRPNSSVVNSSLLEAIHKVINGDSAVTTDQANTVAEGQHLGLHKVVPVRNTPVLLRMLPTNNVLVKQDGSHVTSTSKDHAMSRNATCESVIPHNGHVLQRKPMLVNGHVPNTPLAPTSVGMISVKGKDNCPKASANKKSTAPELQTILEYVNSKWSPKLQKKDLVVNNSVICKTSLASKSRPIYHPAARSNFKEDVPLLQRLDLSIGGVSLPKPAIDVGIRKTEVKKQNVCLLDRPSPFNIEENCSRITSRQVPFKDVPLLQRTDLGVDNILPCKRPGNMSSKNGSNNVIDCSSINDTAAEHLSAHHSAILNREAFLQGKDQTFHDLSSCEPMTNSYCKEMAVTGKRDDLFNHVSEEEPATKRSKIIVPQLDSLMLQRKYPTFNDVLNDRPVMATYSIRDFEGDQTDLTNTPVMLVGSAKHQERMNCLTLQNKKSFLQKMNRVNNIESICQPTVNSDRKKEVCKSISSPFRYTDIEKSITEASDLQKPIRSVGSNAQETCPSVNKAIRSGDTHVQLDHSYVSSVVRSCDTEVHKNDPPVSTVGIPQVIVCVNGREIRLEEEHVDSSGNTIREEASHVHNHSHQSLVEEYCSFETESRKQQQQAAVSVDVNDVSKEKCAPQIIVPSSMDNSAVVHYPQSDSSLINIQEKGDNEDKNLIQDNCNFIGVNDSAIEGSARPRYSISATDTQVLSENCQILSSDQQSVSEERRQEVKLNVSFTDFTNPHISLHHDKAHSISGDCLITQQSVLLNNTEMASEGTDSFTNKQTSQECDITQEMNVHAENPFLWHAREETVDSTFEPSPASGHREAIIEGSSSTTGLQSPNMFEVDPDQQYSVPLENMGLWYIKEEIVENDLTYSPTQETGNKEQIFKNHDSDMLKHAEKDCSNTHKAGEQNSVSLANTVLWQVKETLAEFDSSSQLPPSQGSSRNRVFEEQVINVPTKSGSAVTNPPVTNPPVTYQLTPSVKSTNIGLNVNYQSVGRSSPNQLPKPTIHRIGFLQQGRCATSPILHRGCATSSNLQRGCATSPIFHRGCATSSNLQQGCATSPILHRGSATSPILQRGCATSPLLQRGCATTNSTPGRGPVSACNIVISMRPNLRPHLPGLVRQRCPMPLEREFDVAVSPTLSSEVVVKRPVPATVELIKRVKEKLASPPRGREPACAAADASSAGAWPVQCRGPQQPSRPARILPDKLQTDCKEEVQGRWERLKRRGRPKKRHTFDHPTHPDDRPSETMMDLMYSNPPSNPMRKDSAAAKEPMIFGDDEWDEDEDEDQVTDEAVPAPQVTLDKDGGLVIDERSLFVDVEEVARRRARRGRKKAEDSLAAAICSEQPQPRHRRSKMWRTEETLRFYRALNAVGTDFMMMESLFLDRTRRELKKKFMREDKINRELIDRTLLNPGVVSTTDLERELGEERLKKMREEEQMLEKARLKKERKERRMTKNNQKLLAERKEKLLNNKILFRNKRNYKRTRRKERSPPPPRKVLPPRKAAMKQRRGEQPEGGEDLCRLLEESISRELAGESTPQAAVTQVTTTPGALLVLSAPSATGRVYKVFMVD
ncbi:uncharacterized protein LOC134540498 isoform X3 [Bacillus rossius redtenbacheri]|uniref:uncharacterized protein LOC134540498 isoform X3 n=1 Tax=Bacillus rossius redtenbacheri TaxID=93214 RepID=UPI002FDEC5FD